MFPPVFYANQYTDSAYVRLFPYKIAFGTKRAFFQK